MNTTLKILINPFVLSIVFSLIIIALLPPVFDKYVLDLKLKTKLLQEIDYTYYDLDNDGLSEQIEVTFNSKGMASLYIRDNRGFTIDQWNFDTYYFPQSHFNNVYDINYDGKKEVMLFTRRNDSIFLNAVDPMGTGTYVYQNKFIAIMKKFDGKDDLFIKRSTFSDLNNDGYAEIIFPIDAGFSLHPRKLIAFDYYNDTLYSTVDCGNRLSGINAIDLNKDGITEIIANSWAPRNYVRYNKTTKYHDTSAYIFVFNNELDFFFSPIVDSFSIGDIINNPLEIDNRLYILSMKRVTGKSNIKPSLQLYNYDGSLITQTLLPEIESPFSGKYGNPIIENDKIIIPTSSGKVYYYNYELELKEVREMPANTLLHPSYKSLDINDDGKNEIIAFDLEGNMIIVDRNLKHPVYYNLQISGDPKLFTIHTDQSPTELFANYKNQVWYFTYKFNHMYYWQYPIYVIIFIVILLLNLAIRKMQNIQLEKKYAIKQQITELQLKTIKNQMEPHFMFNALNSIASAIYDEDKNVAYDYFTKVARLVRKTLDDSDKIVRSVEEEINFVKDYLDIEKIRFGDNIDYEIEISEEVDRQFKIPKMLIQIYVENSIKHGIRHKPDGGIVVVKLFEDNHYLTIEIKDNGIGRKKAQELGSKSTGKGQLIIQQYYSLFSGKSKHKIKQVTIDLKDDAGNSVGTKVIIKIPIHVN